ncbi:MAG: hypothetical protein ACYDBZ_00460 [Steroidobacteraceae bacterium]
MTCFLTQYQTIIVGLLGFGGVILTLRTNARLNREQHTKQVEHERTALKAALSAELSIIRDTFRDRIEMIGSPAESQGMWVPVDTMTDVYGRILDKIGLLSREQVDLVLRAYLLIRAVPERLRLMEGSPKVEPGATYLYVGSKHIVDARRMHENFIQDIERAIAALR